MFTAKQPGTRLRVKVTDRGRAWRIWQFKACRSNLLPAPTTGPRLSVPSVRRQGVLLDDPPVRDFGSSYSRRHHSLADCRRMAGHARIRFLLFVDAALGAVRKPAGSRRAESDLRHPRYVVHRDGDRHSGRPRHRDLPDRALPAVAAPSHRHGGRTARGRAVDYLRHVGLLRARPVSGPIRSSLS